MTTNFNPTTADEEALALWLAGLRTRCTVCPACVENPTVFVTCVDGTMARFSEFQKPCPCLIQHDAPGNKIVIDLGYWKVLGGCEKCWDRWFSKVSFHSECESCQGRPWLPDVTEAKLAPALLSIVGELIVGKNGMGENLMEGKQGYYVYTDHVWSMDGGHAKIIVHEGASLREAMMRAMAARVLAEEAESG